MTCPTNETLHAYLDKALHPTQATSVGEHLTTCEACAAESDRVARLAAVLSLLRPTAGCLPAPKLAVFAAGQLDEASRSAFIVHLGRCRKCADALLLIRRSVNARTKTPARAARTVARPAPQRTGSGWLAAAALVVAAIGAGVWLARQSSDGNPGTRVVQPTPPRPAPPAQEPSPEVVHVPPTPGAERPEKPEDLVLDPQPPRPPDPLEDVTPPDPPQHPPQDHAQKPPEPETPQEPTTPDPPQHPPQDLAQKPPEPETPQRPTTPKEQPFDLAAALGSVELLRPGQDGWQPLKEGQTVKAEGRLSLKVGSSKAARVTFAGYTISLDRNSELSVALFERDCELALSRGAALLDGRAAGGRGVSFQVVGARVRAKGGRLLVALAHRQARVLTFDGDVSVEASGREVAVPRGLACLLAEGKAPAEPAKADPAPLLAWTRDLETFVTCEAEKGRVKGSMKVRTDSSASGGRFVTSSPRDHQDEPGSVEVVFEVKRAGVFRVFARTSTGERRERGEFVVFFDGGRPHEIAVRGRGDEWRWAAIDAVELAAGRHVVCFHDPRGGLRIDSIVITTDMLFHPDPAQLEVEREGEPEDGERAERERNPYENPAGDCGGHGR